MGQDETRRAGRTSRATALRRAVRLGARVALGVGALIGTPFGLVRAEPLACPPAPPVFAANGWRSTPKPLLPGPLRILTIGSSSTQGVGASAPSAAYPARLAADLAGTWRIETKVTNAGVAGERAAATLARLKAALAGGGHDLVIWQVGTNDAVAGVDLARFRAALGEGVAAAAAAGAPTILLDPQFAPAIKDRPRYQRYVEAIDEVGEATRTPVFSRYRLMQAWARSGDSLGGFLASDGFHMSDRGYACLARALADVIGGGAPLIMGGRPPAPGDDAKRL